MSYSQNQLQRRAYGLGATTSGIPGLQQLNDDYKMLYPELTAAMRNIRFDAQQYDGVLGRMRQFVATGGAAAPAVSMALNTSEAQQAAVGVLAYIGLVVAQAQRMESLYVAGNPRAMELADRLVSQGQDGIRIANGIAMAARAVSSGTSGLGVSSGVATLLVGLFLAPFTTGLSVPYALVLAGVQWIAGVDVSLGDVADLMGGLSRIVDAAIPQSVKDAANRFADGFGSSLGLVLGVLAGAAAVGIVGYIGWHIYVARKAVRRVTGNKRRRVSAKQLRMGIRVEQEHTRHRPSRKLSRAIAREIAEDHLREMPDYYTKLAKMERGVRRNPDERPVYCPWCGNESGGVLGQLGQRVHYQCRDCGGMWSKKHKRLMKRVDRKKRVRRNGSDVARTILQQLGNGTLFMLGAKNFVDTGRGVQFTISGSPKRISKIVVTLDPSDTYTMQFWKGRGINMKLAAEESNVYDDMLHRMIEQHTALRTSL